LAVVLEVWATSLQRPPIWSALRACRATLDKVGEFISLERFQNLADPDKMRSVPLGGDNAAVAPRRGHAEHATPAKEVK